MTAEERNVPYFPWGRPIRRQEEEGETEEEEMLTGGDEAGNMEAAMEAYSYEITLGRLGAADQWGNPYLIYGDGG